jgi:cytochrome c-type biogenesis protein CcmH
MSPDNGISKHKEVSVEARISKTGMANPQADDLLSKAQTVKVGAGGVKLLVDQVRQ